MMSLKELHAGDGYTYLLRHVVDAEGMAGTVSPLSRYYAESGNPPGWWMGTGLTGLAHGSGIDAGSVVTEAQMERLFKHGTDPATAVPLGRRFAQPKSWRERADARIHALPTDLTGHERATRIAAIETQERDRPARRPVAGFDCVFSPPKSVSALWALAPDQVRAQIEHAHHDALAEVLRVIERDVARTRIGTRGVAQVDTRGVIATAFDHYDSRAGDPQLHTHVVIANRVQGPDGSWRTLDSRGSLFPAAVAMSELYDTLLADHLTQELGVGWERRGTPRKPKNQSWEITGIPDQLITEFSQRAHGIEAVKDDLIAAYRQAHGRDPDDATILRLRQQATYATRPGKQFRSLAEMSTDWRARATHVLGKDPGQWAASLIDRAAASPTHPNSVAGLVDRLATEALTELSTERSTWRTWNIRAAAARVSMPYRLPTTSDRDSLIEAITRRVIELSVCITPPELADTPKVFRRADGTSAFQRSHADVYTTTTILTAENHLLAAAESLTAPVVDDDVIPKTVTASTSRQSTLSDEQSSAVVAIAISGRVVDVLVGPAGSGKTTTLAALRSVWEDQHGDGSVVGLAPSAAAADVLRESLGIATENTTKWLHESTGPAAEHRLRRAAHMRERRAAALAAGRSTAPFDAALAQLNEATQRWRFHAGQLVIVDEASLAGTLTLDTLHAQVERAGAKLLLVGDPAQLSAVDAGGAFGLLARHLGDHAPQLTGVRRFTHAWERDATIRLRQGDTDVVDTYLQHDRVHSGDSEEAVDAAYDAWRVDMAAGLTSLLIAADASTVRDLNARARADRVTAGDIEPDGVALHDGTTAGRGDRVVTRRNNRNLVTGARSWVKNGDHWTVQHRHDDGSLTVTRAAGGHAVTLPAAYVAEHVELGYATTTHRAQGATVDTAHTIVDPIATTRESLYVGMTRGRHANTAYVITDHDDELPDGLVRDAGGVLVDVIRRTGAELSARETITAEQDHATTIARLAAEYDTLAREAATHHWTGLLSTYPLPDADAAGSPAYAALVSAMRRADAHGLNPTTLLPRLADRDELHANDDPLDLLGRRLEEVTDRAAATGRARTRGRMIVGLIPAATHVVDPEMRRALDEREALIEHRAAALVQQAITERSPWLTGIGPAPPNPQQRKHWMRCVTTIAAYRERHEITGPDALGDQHRRDDWAYRSDRRRAAEALHAVRHASAAVDTLAGGIAHERRPIRISGPAL
ncbi:MobF family relaxase [Phytoactinopolyspora halotolerans]|uniref:Relaxase domain-containing protein n=1 Tax=Phytoactinopolyspora halotolerans TaxID=1981512 RepID=A0A6L9S8G8_9ACTN|nr:MobF family relaxase [Phytoactinopolyspora halotolerans]NEE01506.1 relaxase domain-containing protein [Phytoactinopolyspora halotolerans]